MQNIVILHFQPLEKYPPIINIISSLNQDTAENRRITILTNSSRNELTGLPHLPGHIKVKRLAKVNKEFPSWKRYHNYLKYNVYALWFLIKLRPGVVSYFETLSSLPALLYYSLFDRRLKLAVHYHEYSSPHDHKKGMLLNRLFHALERKFFSEYFWVSHTNNMRLRLFLNANPNIRKDAARTIPNYPPLAWKMRSKVRAFGPSIKVVYIGALSCEDMYLEEFCGWLLDHGGEIQFDIYSDNFEASAIEYIKGLNSAYINFKGGTDYHSIPDLLNNYHVGVILYKGTTENYVHNAPNKLFEYLSGDLDVWYPKVMQGCNAYQTRNTYPKVIPLDFNSLCTIDARALVNRKGLKYKPSNFWCEDAIRDFKQAVINYQQS